MRNKWYWAFKNLLIGPFLRVYNRPYISGSAKIPAQGGAILASSHQSVMDSFFLPLLCPRQITFLAKAEYFTGTGLVGGLQRWFFSAVGQVPIDRSSADAAQAAMDTGVKVVRDGHLLGIYPEGTRSPDGRIYRGKTGMARVALETGAPVIPVGMIDSRRANPIGSWILRPYRVGIKIGDPIDPRAYVQSLGLDPDPTDHAALRALTDYVIAQLVQLVGTEYVALYAADVKEQLAAGKGYPPEAVSQPAP